VDVQKLCYRLLAEKGLAAEDLPEFLARRIEKEPVKALRSILASMGQVRRVNRFEEEPDG